ncbi:unnamed protein product [Chrysoparadoxa australica]
MSELCLDDGIREMVSSKRAEELLEKADAKAETICLSGKSYDAEAAAVIAEALKGMQKVKHADLSDMIAGRPEALALEVLELICGGLAGRQLLTLNLSDNAMGEKGINACKAVLEGQKSLQSLKMCNDGLSASAMELMRDILLASSPTQLETLHFFNNMSGDGGAKALAQVLQHCPKLSDLRFSGTRAGSEGSIAVAKALELCPAVDAGRLVSLDLADNSFGTEGAEALAKAIGQFAVLLEKNQKGLTCLNLRDGALGDDGAVLVTAALAKAAAGLTSLDLSGNDLTAKSMSSLARCLRGKPSLIYLGVEENELGSSGAVRLSKGLAGLTALKKIQLSTNEIGSRGGVAVVKSLMSTSTESLTSLELNGNGLSAEALQHVQRMLESAGKLECLGEMDDNDEDFDDEEEDEEEEEEEEEDEANQVDEADADQLEGLTQAMGKSNIA